MRLLKLLRYKQATLCIYDNGLGAGNFPYEYKFTLCGKKVVDRTSHSSIISCIRYAKEDIDYSKRGIL